MKKYIVILVIVLGTLVTGCQKDETTGLEYLQSGQYEEAIIKFEEHTDDKQNQAEAYRGIGLAYWELEDYQRARAAFEKALSYGTEETGTICNFMGICDMKLGYFESAQEWFEKGIGIEGNAEELTKEMMFNQIVACEEIGDWDQAKEKLADYTARYPDDSEAKKEADFLETR